MKHFGIQDHDRGVLIHYDTHYEEGIYFINRKEAKSIHGIYETDGKVVAKGITAYLTLQYEEGQRLNLDLAYWNYFNACKKHYLDIEFSKPDFVTKNPEKDFPKIHYNHETTYLKESKDFFTLDKKGLEWRETIKDFSINYSKWLKINYLNESPTEQPFEPFNPDQLKIWIDEEKLQRYYEIEKELFDRGFIDQENNWPKSQRLLLDFLEFLIINKFFKIIVNKKKMKPKDYRALLAERYHIDRKKLTASAQKHKATIAPFHFLTLKSR